MKKRGISIKLRLWSDYRAVRTSVFSSVVAGMYFQKILCALFVDINSQTRFFIGIKIPTIKNGMSGKSC